MIAKQAADLHSSSVDQAAAAHWLGQIDVDAHVARLCAAYGERRDALLEGLPGALPAGSSWNLPEGGMFVWARLPDGEDAELLLRRALEQRVAFVPGYPFFCGPPEHNALRLSFTRHPVSRDSRGALAVAIRLGGVSRWAPTTGSLRSSLPAEADWERWLEENHAASKGVWVKVAKKATGIESVRYPEVLDTALCFGWIDGRREALDELHFLQRFSPATGTKPVVADQP